MKGKAGEEDLRRRRLVGWTAVDIVGRTAVNMFISASGLPSSLIHSCRLVRRIAHSASAERTACRPRWRTRRPAG